MHRRTLLIVLLLSGAGTLPAQTGTTRANPANLFSQVLELVSRTALDSLPTDVIFEKAARGLITQLGDPYASLLSPEDLARFQRNTLGNRYAGIGATVRSQSDRVTLYRVNEGTPAWRAGLRGGDRLLAIDSVKVSGMPVDSVTSHLLGAAGTPVVVTYTPAGDPVARDTRIVRDVIRVPAVPYTLLLENAVGYVPIQRFNRTAAEDVATAVRALAAGGARKFVLDLRGNGGGDLDAAVDMAGLFLKGGDEVARVVHRGQQPVVYKVGEVVDIGDAPIVVLVNGGSASASEIVAGSLQDHDRAIVVGSRTFGKGLVQTQRVLSNGWALSLTTGKWYTPSGRSIQSDHGGLGDERFVEADSVGKRPVFRSTAGRSVLGGGGVTPEVIVSTDSVLPPERELARAIGNRAIELHDAVYEVARALRPSVKGGFTIQAAWRDSVFERIQRLDLPVTRTMFDAAVPVIDRLLEAQIAGLALGDAEAFRRQLSGDRSAQAALDLLTRAPDQRTLLTLASRG